MIGRATWLAVLGFLPAGASVAAAQDPAGPRLAPRAWAAPSPKDTARLLYKGYGYGSDEYYSPFTVLLNKGYDIYQLRQSKRDFFTFPYKATWGPGIRETWQYPGAAVERFGGWGRFARIELLPLSFSRDELNWVVNYTEHLLGGGITMRMLDEWNRAHRVPFPRFTAMVTTYAASVLNEIVEQPGILAANQAGVADLIFFDVGAILLFHWDQPTRFFANTLQMADWSTQAAFTFPNRQLQNNGQYFTLKIPIGRERTRLFVRGGMGMQFGLSRMLDDEGQHVSVGVGGDTEVRFIDPTGHETVEFAFGAGVYYDRNNSLLWSLTMSPAENLLAVNIYPNSLRGIPRGMGLWGVFTRRHELRFGLVHRGTLGLGAGYGR